MGRTSRGDKICSTNRRDFLRLTAGATLGWSCLPHSIRAATPHERPRVAVVMTEFTYRSHAHVLLENFLQPYLFNGQVTDPGVEVVSFYMDQFPAGEMGRQVASDFRIPIFPTIGEAVGVGTDQLAVDAVLSIGEHGKYPYNEKGQHMYPRKRFFDEVVEVFRRSGRGVPYFNDKHLSYRWDWAKQMYDVSRELDFPLMAGSSVPLAQRRPPWEFPVGAKVAEAISIHGGGVESYDFHALEVLESLIEARQGGETGIRQVQYLDEAALWQAAEEGVWSIELAEAAMAAELGPGQPPLRELVESRKLGSNPSHGVLLSYRDGLTALCLKVGDSSVRWNFACRLREESEPLATSYYVGPWQNRNLFKALSHAIQTHFRRQQRPIRWKEPCW